MMRKLVLFLFVFGGFLQLSNAQLYIINPNDTIEAVAPPSTLTIFDIYQDNVSGDTINLAWTKVSESIPAGWDYSLCDQGTCYPGFPMSGSMVPITPTSYGFIGVNVDPYTFPGTLTVRFYVYETSQPTQGDTITYIITAQTTGVDDVAEADFKLYPNPSSDYIQLQLLNGLELPAKLTIYDLNGKAMLTRNITETSETIDIIGLAAGTYVLEIDNKHKVRKTFVKK